MTDRDQLVRAGGDRAQRKARPAKPYGDLRERTGHVPHRRRPEGVDVGPLPSGGTVRPVTRWGEPVMHRQCRPVTDFDAKLLELVADLAATMDAADGVGLAANQIGVDLRVFVYRCADKDEVVHEGAICNPVLELPTGADRHLEEREEGCLSLPGAYAPCARPDIAVVRGADPDGAPLVVQGTGLLARCLQHETDHLDGIVFGDRLSKRTRRKLYEEAEEMADEFAVTWPAG